MTSATRGTSVLIIGAGPFGLALAAHLKDLGVEYVLAGRPMSFWLDHMPRGMLLRSGLDWHIDVAGDATLEAFTRETAGHGASVLPLARDHYVDYVTWFAARKGIEASPLRVERLDALPEGGFVATSPEGRVEARNVVIATGFRDHARLPAGLTGLLPAGRYGHTCEVVDFDAYRGRSVTIVGGRQSAFESAALLGEAGAREVNVVYRHDTPRFEESDWSWVNALMDRTETEPGWYRELSDDARTELNGRFWAEGRLKLEPWLAPRIEYPPVRLWPLDEIVAADDAGSAMTLRLRSGATLEPDFVLLATGYQVDLTKLPFLAPPSNLAGRVETRDGAPALDTGLQSSVPGLYFTSIAATRDFGPFFAFTVSARCSARLIGDSLSRR